jgi:transposase InsO family protein
VPAGEHGACSLAHVKGDQGPNLVENRIEGPRNLHDDLHRAIRQGGGAASDLVEQIFPGDQSFAAADRPHFVAQLNKAQAWTDSQPFSLVGDPHAVPQTQYLQGMPDEVPIEDLPVEYDKTQGGDREVSIDAAQHSHTLGDSDQELQASQLSPPVPWGLDESTTGSEEEQLLPEALNISKDQDFRNGDRWRQEIDSYCNDRVEGWETGGDNASWGESMPDRGISAALSEETIVVADAAAVVTFGFQQILQKPRTGPEVTLVSQESWNASMNLKDQLSGSFIQYQAYKAMSRKEQEALKKDVRLEDDEGTVVAHGPFRVAIRIDGISVIVPAFVTRDSKFNRTFQLGQDVWKAIEVKVFDQVPGGIPLMSDSRTMTQDGMVALLDTGAGPNVISKRAFEAVRSTCTQDLQVSEYPFELRAADDKLIRSKGLVRDFPVRIGELTLLADMVIVEGLGRDDIILGRQFLLAYDVLLDVPKANFVIRNPTRAYRISSVVQEKETSVKFVARAAKACVLPQHEITAVPFCLQRKRGSEKEVQRGTWLALVDHAGGREMNRRGITPPSALVSVTDGVTNIPMLNVSDGEEELMDGVGTGRPVLLQPKWSRLELKAAQVVYHQLWIGAADEQEIRVQEGGQQQAGPSSADVEAIHMQEKAHGSSMCSEATSAIPIQEGPKAPTAFATVPDLDQARKNLSPEHFKEFRELLRQNEDLFSKNKTDIGLTTLAEHDIELIPGAQPFRETCRRQNPEKGKAAQETVDDLLRLGMAVESKSPFASGIVIVRKKDGSYRMCVDYRKLNAITKKDAYPIPRIDDTIEKLGEARYFSGLDLTSGFWQIPLTEQAKERTAFVSPTGLFEMTRMPFGLCNATATFQRMMVKALARISSRYGNLVLCYIDDILIATRTPEEHLERLQQVFDCLRDANLKIKSCKCQFFEVEIKFLGRVISEGTIKPDVEAVRPIKEMASPVNVAQLRSFLGLTGYYREFVKGYADIVAPLSRLLRTSVQWQWTEGCEEAVQALKEGLISVPILQLPTEDGEYVLDTDASEVALGAVLHQWQFLDGVWKLPVISYGSKTLNSAQRRYSVSRREMLAILTFVEKFACHLAGRTFTVRTDCSSLVWLMNYAWENNALATRWIARLQGFSFKVIHKLRNKNQAADALSKLPQAYQQVHDEWASILKNRQGHHPFLEFLAESTSKEISELIDRLVSNAIRSKGYVRVDELEPVKGRDRTSVAPMPKRRGPKKTLDLTAKDLPDVSDAVKVIALRPRYTKEQLAVEQQQDQQLAVMRNLLRFPAGSEEEGFKLEVRKLNRKGKRWFNQHRASLKVDRDGLLCKFVVEEGYGDHYQVISPRAYVMQLVQRAHEHWGHWGPGKIVAILRRSYDWPGLQEDVKLCIDSCMVCQKAKAAVKKPRRPLRSIKSSRPNELIQIDFVKFASDSEYVGCYVFVDHFTKWCVAARVKNTEANTLASKFWKYWIRTFGFPLVIQTDQGVEFESLTFKELCRVIRTVKIHSSAYHPQTNGLVERTNRTFIGLLRCLTGEETGLWHEWIQHAEMAYNSAVHDSTGFTPHYLMFGRERETPLSMLIPAYYEPETADLQEFARRQVSGLTRAHEVARRLVSMTKG